MKKNYRILILTLVCLCVITLALAGCANEEPMANVIITGAEGEVLNTDISFSENANAGDLITKALDDNNIAYEYAEGYFSSINDAATGDSEGWLLYINGELSDLGAASVTVEEGMKIEMKWMDYAEVWPEFY